MMPAEVTVLREINTKNYHFAEEQFPGRHRCLYKRSVFIRNAWAGCLKFKVSFCVHISFSGATSSKETQDILYARQKIVVVAKAFGLQAIDLVYIDFRDGDGLRRQSREAAAMGFTGRALMIL